MRSILLRGFDQQVAEKLGSVMKNIGVKFVRPAVPSKIEKVCVCVCSESVRPVCGRVSVVAGLGAARRGCSRRSGGGGGLTTYIPVSQFT